MGARSLMIWGLIATEKRGGQVKSKKIAERRNLPGELKYYEALPKLRLPLRWRVRRSGICTLKGCAKVM